MLVAGTIAMIIAIVISMLNLGESASGQHKSSSSDSPAKVMSEKKPSTQTATQDEKPLHFEGLHVNPTMEK
jgi:subtilase family serine protease